MRGRKTRAFSRKRDATCGTSSLFIPLLLLHSSLLRTQDQGANLTYATYTNIHWGSVFHTNSFSSAYTIQQHWTSPFMMFMHNVIFRESWGYMSVKIKFQAECFLNLLDRFDGLSAKILLDSFVRSYYEFIFPLITPQLLQQPLAYGRRCRRLSSSPPTISLQTEQKAPGRSSVLWCAGLKNAYEAFHLICSNKGTTLRGWFSTRYLRNFPSRPTLFAGLIIPV